jgi:hypothetical protein
MVALPHAEDHAVLALDEVLAGGEARFERALVEAGLEALLRSHQLPGTWLGADANLPLKVDDLPPTSNEKAVVQSSGYYGLIFVWGEPWETLEYAPTTMHAQAQSSSKHNIVYITHFQEPATKRLQARPARRVSTSRKQCTIISELMS